MVVLLIHIVLAIGHTIILMASRESSNRWDSVSELLALQHNSRPAPKALHKIGAGIKELSTFVQVGVVRSLWLNDSFEDSLEDPSQAHVELIFSTEEKKGIELQSLLKEPLGKVSRASLRSLSPSIATSTRNAITTAWSIERIQPDVMYG